MSKEIHEQPRVLRRTGRERVDDAERLARADRATRARCTWSAAARPRTPRCAASTCSRASPGARRTRSIGSEFGYLDDFLDARSLVVGLSQSGETIDVIDSMKAAAAAGRHAGRAGQRRGLDPVPPGRPAGPARRRPRALRAGDQELHRQAGGAADGGVRARGEASTRPAAGRAGRERDRGVPHRRSRRGHPPAGRAHRRARAPVRDRPRPELPDGARSGAQDQGGQLHPRRGLRRRRAQARRDRPDRAGHAVPGPRARTTRPSAPSSRARWRSRRAAATSSASRPTPNDVWDLHIPVADVGEAASIVNAVPPQLLGYYLALLRGHDPDKPRNLAKSVTVK